MKSKNNKTTFENVLSSLKISFLSFIILIFFVNSVLAHPPLPTEFYGKVQLFNLPATPGTTIRAYDSSNNLCGTFIVSKTGYYGVLSCNGQDTDGGVGPSEGESIKFKINTYVASLLLPNDTLVTDANITWASGEYKFVTLISPVLVCGDGFCDNYESCKLCSADCGPCPSSGSSGSDSSQTSVSSSSSSSSSSADSGTSASSAFSGELPPEVCEESWTCLEWGDCYINGLRERSCADLNACGTIEYKPPIVENCTYINITTSGAENQTNRTINESTYEPVKESPTLISVCENKLDVLSVPSLIFIVLFIIVILSSYINMKFNISRLRKQVRPNDEDEVMKFLEKEFLVRKESYIFMIVISVISVIVYFYHFFFFLCEDKYLGQLWFLGVLILLAPFVINFIINIMKYEESEKLTKLKLLKDTHYQHFQKMIDVMNNQLEDVEFRIIKSIDVLESKSEFHKILRSIPELMNIYRDMNKLFELYKLKKNAPEIEKDLLFNIDALSKENNFSQIVAEYSELESLKNDLLLLFDMYKTKQDLYDQIYAIEQEYEKEELSKSNIAKVSSENQKKDFDS